MSTNPMTTHGRYFTGVMAYAVPTFVIAYAWHLVLFDGYYDALAIYREDKIIPFGLVTIFIQGGLFTAAYPRLFGPGPVLASGLKYGFCAGLLSWSFTTLAVAAKFPMTSIRDFMLIETAFTVVVFAVVGPLTAWVYRRDLGTASKAA